MKSAFCLKRVRLVGLSMILSATAILQAEPITIAEIESAQQVWGNGVVAIGTAYSQRGDYRAVAARVVDGLYAYSMSPVLFKPTMASSSQFRLDRESALSYFVTGIVEEDEGFALRPWTAVRFENAGFQIDGDSAIAMGNYFFTDRTGAETKVEYTFGYMRGTNGELRIVLHHSSLPFEDDGAPHHGAPALAITESPLPDTCYTPVAEPREIDTVVVHYASAIYWFNTSFQNIVTQEGKDYATSIGLTPHNVNDHKYDWRLVKHIFEAYKVSAHYAIGRDGEIARFVADNDRAWHAGQSVMPNDGRERVNNFSIGIELMSSHPSEDPHVRTPADAYTEAQYESLERLIAHLCSQHDIKYVVGHDEIAPGRKTDPGPLFQWDRVRNADYSPIACE